MSLFNGRSARSIFGGTSLKADSDGINMSQVLFEMCHEGVYLKLDLFKSFNIKTIPIYSLLLVS